MHVHTTRGSGDSSLSPEDLVREAMRIGLDGACLTEHVGPWDRFELREFIERHGFFLIRAMEVETDMGHVTVFGMDKYRSGMNKLAVLRKHADDVGAFLVSAHPFRGLFDYPIRRNLLYPNGPPPTDVHKVSKHPLFELVDAIEVANGANTDVENDFALDVAGFLGKPSVGGSDAHSTQGLGACVTVFEEQIGSEEEFLDVLKAGKFLPAVGLHIGALRRYTLEDRSDTN
jgi:predicted metal-dependent phosphoesterase TrpH